MFVLEEIYKSKKAENFDQFNLSIQRSLSWLKKSMSLGDELDLKLISLWISFNAINAQVQNTKITADKQSSKAFLSKILQLDQEHKIYHLVWEKLSQSIGRVIENPYTFQPFWDYQHQEINQTAWKEAFEIEMKQVHQAVQSKDTLAILLVVFDRLGILKEQIVQGGSTYNSAINRKQVDDGCTILNAILPAFMYIVLENAVTFDLGKPFYPVQQVS